MRLDPSIQPKAGEDVAVVEDPMTRELSTLSKIQKTLQFAQRSRTIDFISVPFSFNMSYVLTQLSEKYPDTDLAIEAPSVMLKSTDQIDKMLAVLTEIIKGRDKVYLLIPTNVFTIIGAARIYEWASTRSSVVTVATETLRTHPRRPGLMNLGTKHVTGAIESHIDMASVLQSLQKAMDSCMKIEKVFLEKSWGKDTGVSSIDVCFAHVLAQTQSGILFPEEWEYIKRTQVEPKLSLSLDLLSRHSNDAREWTVLYQPLSRYLFHTFLLSLEAKKQDILKAPITEMTGGEVNFSLFLFEMLRLLSVLRVDHILLQGTITPSDTLLDYKDEGKHQDMTVQEAILKLNRVGMLLEDSTGASSC